MKIIICPDSFKGSLSSVEVADAIERGIKIGAANAFIETVAIPIADGGEGTVDALVRATGGRYECVEVHDPLMRKIKSNFGILGDGKTAVIEMSAASGLTLLKEDERNPLITTTYGTGELIKAALDLGVEKIIIGIGGSATNDGGFGAMSALGAKFLDADGNPIQFGGAALAKLDRIDISDFNFPFERVSVEVACDVTNPLTGPNGASAVYGPQKGATPSMVAELDAALTNYADVIERCLNKSVKDIPGGGAAGGLGAGLNAFLNAELRSGIDMVLDAVHFNDMLSSADLIITGEGRIDEQTAFGKTIGGILKRASAADVPVIAIAGSISGNIQALYDTGLTSAFSICNGPMSLEQAINSAEKLIENLSINIVRTFLSGAK